MENVSPFLAEHDLRKDIVVTADELCYWSKAGYRRKNICVGGTFADPYALVHMGMGSAAIDAFAISLCVYSGWYRLRIGHSRFSSSHSIRVGV